MRCTSQLICSTCHAPHTPLQQVHTPAATLDPDTAAAVNEPACSRTYQTDGHFALHPFFDNMLRSKTQVVDDTIPTKTSLKAVHNEGCAFTTAFTHIPNSSQLQVPSHAPTTVHQQRTDKTNRPNTIFMQQAVACHPEDRQISAVVQLAYERRAERGCCARRSYASCTMAEIFRSSGWHATACCTNIVFGRFVLSVRC